jgi:excinuclease ABC subunit C
VNLRETAGRLPESPGVYIMQDAYGNIIYIGKAKNLRRRVSQYFRSSNSHTPKVLKMVGNIRSFDYILADTELEALLLECRMIKDLKPMYNSQMKNDLDYVYLRLMEGDRLPGFEIAEDKEEAGVFFGPYAKYKKVETALAALQDNFKIRHCKSFAAGKTGCLNHQLGLCTAPCIGEIGDNEYMEQVQNAVDFLEGRNLDILEQLDRKMTAAAEALDFRRAAKYRDDLRALKSLVSRQAAIGFNQKSRSIIAIEEVTDSVIKLFIISGSRILYKEKLELPLPDGRSFKEHIRELVMACGKDASKTREIGKQEIDQAHIVYSYIKNKKDCSYMLIPKSWLTKSNISRLEQGIEKLLLAVLKKT